MELSLASDSGGMLLSACLEPFEENVAETKELPHMTNYKLLGKTLIELPQIMYEYNPCRSLDAKSQQLQPGTELSKDYVAMGNIKIYRISTSSL